MKTMLKLLVPMVFVSLIGLGVGVHAERGDAASQQQEMNQIMDMLKKGGMDPKQMQQMQDMFKGMEEQGRLQSSNKLKKEQQQFEAKTAGHGTAQVEVEGKRYDLKIVKCEITDRNAGRFSIHAQQAPGLERGDLWVSGGGGHSGNSIQLSLRRGDPYEASGSPTFQLNGKDLDWEGMVVKEGKTVPLKFNLTCGVELVDYATPSKPNPKAAVNVLTLQMGQETHTFEAGLCSTKEYRTGNLIVEFESTATGTFRGRPAMVLLSKSHPAESKRSFQNMDVLLGELTPEQRLLSPLKVQEQLRKKVEIFGNIQRAAIKKKYDPKMAAYQEKFDAEMPALKEKYGKQIPPDKMKELMDPFNKLSDVQSKEMNEVSKQVKAMRYPAARSFGAITVTGQEIHFGGSKLSTSDAARAPEFKDFPEQTELWVTCGE